MDRDEEPQPQPSPARAAFHIASDCIAFGSNMSFALGRAEQSANEGPSRMMTILDSAGAPEEGVDILEACCDRDERAADNRCRRQRPSSTPCWCRQTDGRTRAATGATGGWASAAPTCACTRAPSQPSQRSSVSLLQRQGAMYGVL